MKIILLVEGDTEKEVLPGFLQRWLAGKVDPLPAIKAVNTRGCDNHIKECATKARLHLAAPDVLAVFGLLDLHGPKNIPAHCTSIKDKCDHLRQRRENENARSVAAPGVLPRIPISTRAPPQPAPLTWSRPAARPPAAARRRRKA
ncbi:MAG: hypothetical protein AAGU21_11110 [Solidesulfovibrio sp.]|uniref:hypothetical protein n=1 Tax=Solidesulfovibrio sp. TaxID=2910990 RepID=UPI0031583A35